MLALIVCWTWIESCDRCNQILDGDSYVALPLFSIALSSDNIFSLSGIRLEAARIN